MAGPIIYLLGMNLVLLAVKIMCGLLGYNLGTSIIGTMTEQIERSPALQRHDRCYGYCGLGGKLC